MAVAAACRRSEFEMLTFKEKVLYHQIHPLKLFADIGCEPLSLYFFWQRDLLLGLTTHLIPPIVASVLVIRYADLERLKNSRAGAFLERHMTKTVEGVRLAGDIVMVFGAWFHQPVWIALGLAIAVAAWSSGMLRKPLSN
jgi:hypothetical protein